MLPCQQGAGGAAGIGRGQSQNSWFRLPNRSPIAHESAQQQKLLGKMKVESKFGMIIFLENLYVWWNPAFLKMAEYLQVGSREWIPVFALLAHPGIYAPWYTVLTLFHMCVKPVQNTFFSPEQTHWILEGTKPCMFILRCAIM